MPLLLQSGIVSGDQANTLQRFYLQVDQIHRGLDNVDDFLRGKTQDQPAAGITLQKEKERFLLKAEELRAASAEVPASALYKESVAAFEEV